MKERAFMVRGLKPGKHGGLVWFVDTAVFLIDDDVTPEQVRQQPDAVKKAYEDLGYTRITVCVK